MSDLIQIDNGNPPWCPTPETTIVDVIHEYDKPLLAVIEQRGTEFMARCLLGEMGPKGVWAYSRLDVVESAELREGSPEQIDETAEYLTQGSLTAAMVDDDRIVYSMVVDVPEGTFADRVRSIVDQVHDQLTGLQHGADNLAEAVAHTR